MGDIIEVTVRAAQPFLFYKTSGNGIWFELKAHSKALVGLGKDCVKSDHWFEFRNTGEILFSEKDSPNKRKAGLPFTLSEDEYTKFWIAWDFKSVRVGIGNSMMEIFCTPISTQLTYVTFANKDTEHTCSFKFAVPPLCIRKPLIHDQLGFTKGNLEWKQCDNQLPDNAVIGGNIDGEIVYIVRAHHRRSLTPGVFVPSKGLAFIPWGGSDNPTSNFEALCGFNFVWKKAYRHRVPVDAFVAGYSEINNESLYIGRAIHQGNNMPGKVQLSHKVCYIAHQEKEIALKKFEVLTVPGLNKQCSNKYLDLDNWAVHNNAHNDAIYNSSDDEDYNFHYNDIDNAIDDSGDNDDDVDYM